LCASKDEELQVPAQRLLLLDGDFVKPSLLIFIEDRVFFLELAVEQHREFYRSDIVINAKPPIPYFYGRIARKQVLLYICRKKKFHLFDECDNLLGHERK